MTVAGVMTTAQAVTRISEDLLDDANNRRWTSAQIIRALRASLDRCILDYLQGGGSRFRRIDSLTTDANGKATLEGSAQPEDVLFVVRVDNGIREELEPISYKDAVLFDDESGVTVEVCYPSYTPIPDGAVGDTTKLLVYPAAGTDGLIPAEGGAYAMEDWVVKRAAAELAVKDIARYAVLSEVAQEARRSVMGAMPTQRSGAFGAQQRYSRSYRYCWNGADIQLVRWG